MLKKVLSILFSILVLFTSSITAFAHDVPNLEASGTITIHLKSADQDLKSGTLTFYQVGEIFHDDGNYSFQLTAPFADCGTTLEDIHSAKTAELLSDYAKQQNLVGTTVSIENGIVQLEISQGNLGLYLVVQQQESDGWQTLNPFLISVPNMEDGKYIYHVDATPKIGELIPKPNDLTPIGPTLPHTGQLNWPIPVLVILGLSLFAVGWKLRFREKRNDCEK